jgi:hypothetical protein
VNPEPVIRAALDSLAIDRAYRSALATAMAQIAESAAAQSRGRPFRVLMGAEKRLECFDKLSMNGNSRDLDIVRSS